MRVRSLPLTLAVWLVVLAGWPLVCAASEDAPQGLPETEARLTAVFDRGSAPVGGVATLVLRYGLPPGAELPAEPNVGGLEGLAVIERTVAAGEIRFGILVDRLGTLETGPLTLTYQDASSDPGTLTAEGLKLEVHSNLGEKPAEAELAPIFGIYPTRTLWQRAFPWLPAAVAVGLVALGVWLVLRRRRSLGPSAAVEAPHAWARKELERLDAAGMYEKGQVKIFYFRLSEILRTYLERLRGFPAAESTTEEIARYVREEPDHALLPLLRAADLVKFADTQPSPARKDEDVRAARDYIRTTGDAADRAQDPGAGP